ncbi:MAG: YbaK/EbsC family protein [Synergistetes bacterium]|nr:YbaK/EbsC family protein [Synergistota bacterium]
MAGTEKVKEILRKFNIALDFREFPQSTRTSQDAANAVGCKVEQIGKSIVFKGKASGRAYLVIASGKNRVNERRLSQIVGEPIEKADADFVKEKTGFVIGGVPPFGHREPLETYVDEDLFLFEEIWCAGGTPHAVFKIRPEELLRITGGTKIKVK